MSVSSEPVRAEDELTRISKPAPIERLNLKTVGAPKDDAAGPVVVFGVDGTAESLHALRQATAVLRAIGGRAVVVHTRETPVVAVQDFGGGSVIRTIHEAEEDIGRATEREVFAVCSEAQIPVEFIECDGDVGRSIIDIAHKVDASCVVVGATIHGAVTSLFLSSVAEYLLHHCDLSLVIVRPEQPERE